jgi:hypothetical protein
VKRFRWVIPAALAVAFAAGLGGRWAGRVQDAPDGDAAGAVPGGPVLLPLQARFGANQPAPGGRDERAARALWDETLVVLARGERGTDTEALARPVWERFPGTDPAVAAQLLVLGNARGEVPRHGGQLSPAEFARQALAHPAVYFTERRESASQAAAAAAVRQLAAEGKAREAWTLCLRLRWIAPRVNILAPACREVSVRFPTARFAPDDIPALLPAAVEIRRLGAGALNADGIRGIRRYVADPYDPGLLARTLVILWQADLRDTAIGLRPELLGLDPETLWRLETNARPFGSVKGILRLSLVPWQD